MPGVPPSSNIVPPRRSMAQLRRSVASYVQAPDDNEALDNALVGINSGIDILNTYTWFKYIPTQSIPSVAGDRDYSLDGEIKDPRMLELLDSGGTQIGVMDYLPLKSFLDDVYFAVVGDPYAYSINYVTRELLLSVAPSASWVARYPTMRLWYFPRFAKLIETDDMYAGPPEHEEFLLWHGRAEIAAVRRPAAAGYAEGRAMRILTRLRADDSNAQTDYPK